MMFESVVTQSHAVQGNYTGQKNTLHVLVLQEMFACDPEHHCRMSSRHVGSGKASW